MKVLHFNIEYDYRAIFEAGLRYLVDETHERLRKSGIPFDECLKLEFRDDGNVLWIRGPIFTSLRRYSSIPINDPSDCKLFHILGLMFFGTYDVPMMSQFEIEEYTHLMIRTNYGSEVVLEMEFGSMEELIMKLELSGYLENHLKRKFTRT